MQTLDPLASKVQQFLRKVVVSFIDFYMNHIGFKRSDL